MNECPRHWAMLRAKVESLGLTHLIAGDATEVHARMSRAMDAAQDGSTAPASDFDPLMSMSFAIFTKAMHEFGPGLMVPEADGKLPCALCHIFANYQAHLPGGEGCHDPACGVTAEDLKLPWDENWVNGCGEAHFHKAKALGLIKVN